ncbi:MAG: chitobiase/beta-hexosaminidase C-terminal domain-containing protein [Leptospira sp.]|nr:chitobiase/beta-hexosaminidase C-terminal domain-containing protein [Leptospira sp.]
MKKYISYIFIFWSITFSGCLQFQENDLDPNSPLSNLLSVLSLGRQNSEFRISPAPDLYFDPVDVQIFSPPGSVVRFTLDGSFPNQDSFLYTSPIPIAQIAGKLFTAQAFDGTGSPISEPIQAEYRFYNLETGLSACYDNNIVVACNGDRQDGDFQLGLSESWQNLDSVYYLDRMTGITWQRCQHH